MFVAEGTAADDSESGSSFNNWDAPKKDGSAKDGKSPGRLGKDSKFKAPADG